jgi:hypothetical protein
VASRYVDTRSNGARFGLRIAGGNKDYEYMFVSSNLINGDDIRLRAVVSLGTNVQIEKCTGTNSETNMHKITSYGE